MNSSTSRRMAARLGATALMVAVAVAVPPPAWAAEGFVAGAPGLGDPFFPLAGNGGYDVTNYSIELGYDPATRHLDGTTTIAATTMPKMISPRGGDAGGDATAQEAHPACVGGEARTE